MRSKGAAIPHLPGLDGLRGLAVIGVLFFHADGLLRGGYLGVDLFFVLSGFLITSILVAEARATGAIDLKRFWIRRARRLFPALLSLMPAVALYAAILAKPDELEGLRKDAFATLGYVANWRAIFSDKSYWDLFAAPSPLEHTWSLSIEEQFYVAWPLVAVGTLVRGRGSIRRLFAVTAVLYLLSVAAMWGLFDPERTTRAYFGTDTRAAAILLGAAFSTLVGPDRTLSGRALRLLDALGVLAAVGLGIAWVKLDGQATFLYRGGFWATELAAIALIACATSGKDGVVARLLSLPPLRLAGAISYGVYLWHWPIDCVLTVESTHAGPLLLNTMRFAATLVVAVLSYRYFERPIRTRGLPFGRATWVVPLSFAGSALFVVLGTRARPAPPAEVFAAPKVAAAPQEGAYPTPFSVGQRVLPKGEELRPGTLRVLVLGDSVAGKMGIALRYRQDEFHAFVAERSVGDCSILTRFVVNKVGGSTLGESGGCAANWLDDVRELRPDVTLVVLGGGFFARVRAGDRFEGPCERSFHDMYRARLEELVTGMQDQTGQIAITLAPYPLGRWRSEGLLPKVDCFNGILRETARAMHVPVIDLATHVCPTEECNLFSDGKPIRPDGLHPDGVGAEESARWVFGRIGQILSEKRQASGDAPSYRRSTSQR